MSAPKRASKRCRTNVEELHTISPRSKSAKISHPKEEPVTKQTRNPHPESNLEDEKVIAPALATSEEDEEEETDDEEDENDEPETFMAITAHQGRIGAAFFDPAERTLQLLEDTSESHHFDLTRLIFEQLHPDIVLSSSRADEAFIRQCQIYMDETASRFQVRPHKEFSPNQGKEKLLSLRVISEIEDYESMEQNPLANAYDFMRSRNAKDPYIKKWAASIRTSNFATMTAPLCMSAAGALLDHLVRIHATGDLSVEGIGGLDIVDIHALSLRVPPTKLIYDIFDTVCREQFMLINVDALHSLQVFAPESHASIHSEKTKEGLSLFGGPFSQLGNMFASLTQ
ncbi:MutS protein msh5 [Tulasnella sp. 424]|nr:MutS protein msh5 [Tulasnella sp. 424]KAG8968459.1 MutS protein msh5 [Tulasnella sp. 425]